MASRDGSGESGYHPQHNGIRRTSTRKDVAGTMMRGVKTSSSSRVGATRSTTYNKNSIGHDRIRAEHPLSSASRLAAEEGAAAASGGGGGGPLGTATAAGRAGAGVGGGHRRMVSDMGSSQSDFGVDRRGSQSRDPLRRSEDTCTSDTPSMAERGGHGRDGLVILRDPVTTAAAAAVTTTGGGNTSRAGGGGAGNERDRATTAIGSGKVGEEELPTEVPGRYEKMRVLGRGSFGAVTLVKDHRDSKLYAMKTLNCADKLEDRVTAMAEVRLLKWLKHPCVLTLFDVFLSADGRLVCLTTTYCESGDLAKTVKHAAKTKSLLGEKTVLGWFAQLCLGVEHLHEEKKVLHRDIKPNNVFLMDSKKIIQLGDFGLAKVINDGDKQVKAEVGTPYYTSPEMCNNQPYGFPSDVWSLGIVLYELLALDVPFRSRDVVALVSQVIKAPPPPLPEVYSEEVTALTRWMLQKDPLRRPTLTQVLACQPLRRHMSSFVKHYRPMNMAERQRRQDIKELEAQVAAIIERGGDDPQIPRDVNDGCGSLPTGDLDESADGPNQPLEARIGAGAKGGDDGETGDEGVAVEAAGAGEAPGDAGAADGGIAASRARPIDRGSGGNLGLTSTSPDGTALGTDEDDTAVAVGAAGACSRCGARVTCGCGGVRGGAGANGAGGGGNNTPGRRFGSPQQSKGLRNVMSWAPGVSMSASIVPKVRGSGTSDDTTEINDGDSDEGSGRKRRPSTGCGGDNAGRWNPRPGAGSGGSDSSEESFRRSSGSPGSKRRARRKSGNGERGAMGDPRDHQGSGEDREEGVTRERSTDVGLRRSRGEDRGWSASDQGNKSNGSGDNGAAVPARPKSPRSPRSHNFTRPKRVSGGGGGAGASGGGGRDDFEGERLPAAVAPAVQNSTLRRESSTTVGTGGGEEGDGLGRMGGVRLARYQPPRVDDGTPADATGSAAPSSATPEVRQDEGEEVAASSSQEAGAASDGSTASLEAPTATSGAPPAAEVAERAMMASGDNADGPTRPSRSAAAAISMPAVAASGEPADAAMGAGARAGGSSSSGNPRTPRSPRLVGSGSEVFKTAKRLSEALTFAAEDSERGLVANAATAVAAAAAAAAGRGGPSPRRDSEALEGYLAAAEEAAAAAASGAHRDLVLEGSPRTEGLSITAT